MSNKTSVVDGALFVVPLPRPELARYPKLTPAHARFGRTRTAPARPATPARAAA